MRSSRAVARGVLVSAVFVILFAVVSRARAADAIPRALASPKARAEHLVVTPANLHFGKVAVGQQNVRTVTITNSGDSSITLFQVITKGSAFTLSGLDLPMILARGESFTFKGTFAPRFRGDIHGSISFITHTSSIASPSLRLELAGVGTDSDQLTVDPPTMDFGTVLVGSFVSQVGKLTASGSQVTITSANISSPDFTLSGLSFPFTIPAGGSQEYMVIFAPQAIGTELATLSFLYGAGDLAAVQSLTGIGAVTQAHSVDLSWNASTSQDVIGYNVYRGIISGGPYRKINPVLNASTVYTDTSVSNGTTYYYVTTAVNSSEQESVHSNEAQAIIPSDESAIPGSMRSPSFGRRIAGTGSPSRNGPDLRLQTAPHSR